MIVWYLAFALLLTLVTHWGAFKMIGEKVMGKEELNMYDILDITWIIIYFFTIALFAWAWAEGRLEHLL